VIVCDRLGKKIKEFQVDVAYALGGVGEANPKKINKKYEMK
jgi:hypothetical protein